MPSWKDLKKFCERDGWKMVKQKSDHWWYEKEMAGGEVKVTKISRGTGEIRAHLWKEILKKQLKVTQEYFNRIK